MQDVLTGLLSRSTSTTPGASSARRPNRLFDSYATQKYNIHSRQTGHYTTLIPGASAGVSAVGVIATLSVALPARPPSLVIIVSWRTTEPYARAGSSKTHNLF